MACVVKNVWEAHVCNYSWKLSGSLRSTDVGDCAEVDLGDGDHDEYLSESVFSLVQ